MTLSKMTVANSYDLVKDKPAVKAILVFFSLIVVLEKNALGDSEIAEIDRRELGFMVFLDIWVCRWLRFSFCSAMRRSCSMSFLFRSLISSVYFLLR